MFSIAGELTYANLGALESGHSYEDINIVLAESSQIPENMFCNNMFITKREVGRH